MSVKKKSTKPLGIAELISVAVGGMIGGGIFSILGVSVLLVGNLTPIAMLIGGVLAFFAAYSYAKLAVYYKDEGATYSFFKKTFPDHPFAASVIGWLVIFGYISTLALYTFTFSSYFCTLLPFPNQISQKIVSFLLLSLFAALNLYSVKGMGKVEDVIVFVKIALMLLIALLFIMRGNTNHLLPLQVKFLHLKPIFTASALTFVSFEGFQLAINAYKEVNLPDRNVPLSIYWSIGIVTALYFILAMGALFAIPSEQIIKDKEFALAAGATKYIGKSGYYIVLLGAMLATSSAINGTIFGASRTFAIIAQDGFFPKIFAKRSRGLIPHFAIIAMAIFAYGFILTGNLETIIEFGSMTFILVSFLMSWANFKIRAKTQTHPSIALICMAALLMGMVAIIVYEISNELGKVLYIFITYAVLTLASLIFANKFNKQPR